jgi:hypothetical protein
MSVGLFFFSMPQAYHDRSSISRGKIFKLTHYGCTTNLWVNISS